VEEIPADLLAQLKDGGRIGALFMEGALGIVRIGHKAEGRITWRFAFNATAPVLPGFAAAKAFAL
jgi:protein-L-isoaspartate(D-aspartate) O-methyltransferase